MPTGTTTTKHTTSSQAQQKQTPRATHHLKLRMKIVRWRKDPRLAPALFSPPCHMESHPPCERCRVTADLITAVPNQGFLLCFRRCKVMSGYTSNWMFGDDDMTFMRNVRGAPQTYERNRGLGPEVSGSCSLEASDHFLSERFHLCAHEKCPSTETLQNTR